MPFYLLKVTPSADGDGRLMVTADGFPEVRSFAVDEEDALATGRDAIKSALAKRRAVSEPIPEPLSERPSDKLVVEILDDWIIKDPVEDGDLAADLRIGDDVE